MKTQLRNKYLSRPHINRYLLATENNNSRAKRLYNANIRLAQAFHPILTQFEVILRNSLNKQLSVYYGDTDWIVNQKLGFMNNLSLKRSNYFLKKSIQKSETKRSNRAIPVTSGKIISDQTFGFWVALYLPHHYKLIGGEPIKIFTNKSSSENRSSIYNKLLEIREFRNRTNHCEPLCFIELKIDCSKAIEIRNNLYNLMQWIEPELVSFFQDIDNIQNKVNAIMKI
jgi:hypothetical protein